MVGRTFFLGGVHGVGKGMLCQTLVQNARVTCVSASTLIREYRPSDDGQKRVEHVEANQSALLNAFFVYRSRKAGDLVIDGHFVLFGTDGEIKEIEDQVFEALNPGRLLLMTDQPDVVRRRLLARDGSAPSVEALRKMEKLELRKAESVSAQLGLPLKIVAPNYSIQEIIDFLGLGRSGPA